MPFPHPTPNKPHELPGLCLEHPSALHPHSGPPRTAHVTRGHSSSAKKTAICSRLTCPLTHTPPRAQAPPHTYSGAHPTPTSCSLRRDLEAAKTLRVKAWAAAKGSGHFPSGPRASSLTGQAGAVVTDGNSRGSSGDRREQQRLVLLAPHEGNQPCHGHGHGQRSRDRISDVLPKGGTQASGASASQHREPEPPVAEVTSGPPAVMPSQEVTENRNWERSGAPNLVTQGPHTENSPAGSVVEQ